MPTKTIIDKLERADGPSLYDMLKREGHSPAKAKEIELDYNRGAFPAAAWVAILRARSQGGE